MQIPKLVSIIVGLGGAIAIVHGISTIGIYSIIPAVIAVVSSILMINHYSKKQLQDESVIKRINMLETNADTLAESLSEEPNLTIRELTMSKENLDEGCIGNLSTVLWNQSQKSITKLMIMHQISSEMRPHLELFSTRFKTFSKFLHQGNSSIIPMIPYKFESPIYGHLIDETKFYLYLWLTYKFNQNNYENIIEIEFLNGKFTIFGQHNNEDVLTKRTQNDKLIQDKYSLLDD